MPKLQLKRKPHSTASGIYDNSVFQTGRINLQGDGDGIGIFIGSTQALTHENDLRTGITYNDAALLVNGGVLFGDDLYVEEGITTNGNLQIGMSGSAEQIVSLGLPVNDMAWRMRKLDETIRWEKFNMSSGEWDLMIRFSEC